MYLSANIQQIRDYVSHLEQERHVAEDLANHLHEWKKQASDLGENELSFIDRHLRIAQNQIRYINRRIALLGEIAENLQRLQRETEALLDEARILAMRNDGSTISLGDSTGTYEKKNIKFRYKK